MTIFALNCLYWIIYYYCISYVLDRVRHKLNYKFDLNLEWLHTVFRVRKWKERYPEVSEIDKNDFFNSGLNENSFAIVGSFFFSYLLSGSGLSSNFILNEYVTILLQIP